MPLPFSSFNAARSYLLVLLFLCGAGLAVVEVSVRSMSRAHCVLTTGLWSSCGAYESIKGLMSNRAANVVLGDSHMKFAENAGFKRYQIPAARPGEVLIVTKYLLKRGHVERAIIGLASHHMRDNSRIRMQQPLSSGTLVNQWFPFSVYFLEPEITIGLKRYLWHALTRRPLPAVAGRPLRTREELDELELKTSAVDEIWQKTADRSNMRWWQNQPIRYRDRKWQNFTQRERDLRTKKRFDRLYPMPDFRDSEVHKDLLALLSLLQANAVNACFVRMPHSNEWEILKQRPEYQLYDEVQKHLENLVRENGYRYVNTAELKLELKKEDFINTDHLHPYVMDQLTPVVVDACFDRA